MSSITIVPTGANLDRPATRKFGGRGKMAKASPEIVARQAKITLLAFQKHDDRADALAFLNGHSEELGGRVLDVAGDSDEGLAAATALLTSR